MFAAAMTIHNVLALGIFTFGNVLSASAIERKPYLGRYVAGTAVMFGLGALAAPIAWKVGGGFAIAGYASQAIYFHLLEDGPIYPPSRHTDMKFTYRDD